jgi:hypothetical protein
VPTIEVVQGLGRLGDKPEVSTRRRVVWTREEKRRLDRVAADFNRHGDKFLLRCGNPACPSPVIALQGDGTDAAGALLRCGCTDRVFSRTC